MKELIREVKCNITFIEEKVLGDRRDEETKRLYVERIKAAENADNVVVTKIRDFYCKKDITREIYCQITYIHTIDDQIAQDMVKDSRTRVFKTAFAEAIKRNVNVDHVEVKKIKCFVRDLDAKPAKRKKK